MLSILPELFFLKLLAPTLLRVVIAVFLLFTARFMLLKKKNISATRIPIVGHVPEWAVLISSLLICLVAGLLFIGAWTQVAAIVGAIISLKHAYAARYYSTIVPFEVSTYLLMFCICLSLIVTGAGAFAFDLPL